MYQAGDYLYPGHYSQAICQSQIGWYRLRGKTQYTPGKQVLVRSWLWKIYYTKKEFSEKILPKNKEIVFKNSVINVQSTGYNGAGMVV